MSKILLPNERHYHIKCKIVSAPMSYEDEQSRGKAIVTEEMIFLVPEVSSESMRFFGAWLPHVDTEHFEVVAMLPHPINGPCRLSVHRGSRVVHDHHLFVMSVGVERELKKIVGSFIEIDVLPEDEDEYADQMIDADLPFNKKQYIGGKAV